jgi:hypothetical protein
MYGDKAHKFHRPETKTFSLTGKKAAPQFPYEPVVFHQEAGGKHIQKAAGGD